MKKIFLLIFLSALVLPAMADASKSLENILANKELAKEISSALDNLKEQKNLVPYVPYYEKANKALDILIEENESLRPLLEKVKHSYNNLTAFLEHTEYKDENTFKQTCKNLFYYLDALALDISEIEKADKNLAKTIEQIVNHPYFFNALTLETNISIMITLVKKYYNPVFYDNMAIAQSSLIKEAGKTGYDKLWEGFIDNWLKNHIK